MKSCTFTEETGTPTLLDLISECFLNHYGRTRIILNLAASTRVSLVGIWTMSPRSLYWSRQPQENGTVHYPKQTFLSFAPPSTVGYFQKIRPGILNDQMITCNASNKHHHKSTHIIGHKARMKNTKQNRLL